MGKIPYRWEFPSPHYHRENGGTLAMVSLIFSPTYTVLVGIYRVYLLLKDSLRGQTARVQGGPLPVISRVITPISRVSYNPSYPFIRPFIGVITYNLLIAGRGPTLYHPNGPPATKRTARSWRTPPWEKWFLDPHDGFGLTFL